MRLKLIRKRSTILVIFICLLLFLLCSISLLLDGNQGLKGLDQFEWPPFIDVRAEVDRQLLGKPPAAFVINRWADFRTVIEPDCADWFWNGSEAEVANVSSNNGLLNKEILVLVKTAPDRTEQRAAIRASYGAFKGVNGYRVRTLFIMGSMLRWRFDWLAKLEAEARQWGDLLVGEHEDAYVRSCFKFANAIKLARNFCGRSHAIAFLQLMDDDYVLFPWELVKQAQTHSPATDRVYEGYCFFNKRPGRGNVFRVQKWRVTPREYPFNEYPLFCSGGTILLSRRTIEEFFLAIQHVEFFVWEDVYIGILAHLLGIRPSHNPKFWAIPHNWEPFFMNCFSAYWKNAPRCNGWQGIVSAHGYSPAEMGKISADGYSPAVMGKIYAKVHGRWQQQHIREQQRSER